MKCDVLVVGAGPAGASAARAAAAEGAEVILIDKKHEVGLPVKCAEGVGRELIEKLPIKVPRKLLRWRTKGVNFWIYGVSVPRTGGEWEGYSIDRHEFDRWLAEQAVNAGAELMLRSELRTLKLRDGKVVTAGVHTPEGMLKIEPEVVIAADGVEFRVLRLLGKKVVMQGNCGYVLGYELEDVEIEEPELEHVFIGDFAPGGYGYLFPKSETVANVGVGMLFPKKSYLEYYREFITSEPVRRQTASARVVADKSGWAPYRYVCEWVNGNVLFTGDAANQNFKPLVEGFAPGIICGSIAGKLAAEHCRGSAELQEYRSRVMNVLGEEFRYSDRVMNACYSLMKTGLRRDAVIAGGISAGMFSPDEAVRLREKSESELMDLLKYY